MNNKRFLVKKINEKELGANEKWGPGTFTSGGIPEAIVNQFALGEYTVEKVFKGVLKK